MIATDTIKAAVVSKLKSNTTLTGALVNGGGAAAIKEAQYQGSDYNFPAVRVMIVRQTPLHSLRQCDIARFLGTIYVYAEGPSSQPCDNLAGIVNGVLHRHQVKGGTIGTDGFYIPELLCSGLSGAVRLNERLWRAEFGIEGNIVPSDDMGGS